MSIQRSIYSIFLIILFGVFGGCGNNKDSDNNSRGIENEKLQVRIGKKKKELFFSFKSLKNREIKRIWKQVKIEPKLKIGGIDKETFLYPSLIRTDERGNIYVLDNMDCSVKKFSEKGEFIGKYGKKGKGPGEFISAFDFDVFNEKVIILGPNDNKVSVFDGNKIYEYKFKLMPLKICSVTNNEILSFQITDPMGTSPFSKINYINKSKVEYQNILSEKNIDNNFVGMLPFLIGDIHRYDKGQAVYISAVMGYVVIFDDNGAIENVFKLIDSIQKTGLDQRKDIKEGWELPLIRFPKLDEYLFLSSNIYGDKLFIMSNQAVKEEDKNIVDIYSLSEAEYKYSMKLKNMSEVVSLYFSNNKLYVTNNNTEVVVYDYSIPE